MGTETRQLSGKGSSYVHKGVRLIQYTLYYTLCSDESIYNKIHLISSSERLL
jgi:hypothetical protein